MSKILVKQAVGVDYSLSGQPVMVLGGGRGGQARGRTLRERAGGLLGGTVGVLGALTGQHRSLGGLAQSMISGGAQGAGLGAGLGAETFLGAGLGMDAAFSRSAINFLRTASCLCFSLFLLFIPILFSP